MGVTEDLDNLYHCCGFSAGIAAAGGAGFAMANWIIDGDPGLDLWPFDVRRFGPSHNVPASLQARSVDAYEHYYDIAYPNRELARRAGSGAAPLYDRTGRRGAVFGTKFGWERANWFAPEGADPVESRPSAAANAFDRSPRRSIRRFARRSAWSTRARSRSSDLRPGALELLQRVAGAELDVAAGKVVYTQLLNAGAGIEADVTSPGCGTTFYLVTGSGFGRHDVTFLLQHAPTDGSVTIREVTSALRGAQRLRPRGARGPATPVLERPEQRCLPVHDSPGRLTWRTPPARALRATYVGELGWELHVPVEYAADLYTRIRHAGSAFGLRDVGYRAVESLRLEKQYLAWAVDIRSDNNPYGSRALLRRTAGQAGAPRRPGPAQDP